MSGMHTKEKGLGTGTKLASLAVLTYSNITFSDKVNGAPLDEIGLLPIQLPCKYAPWHLHRAI